MNVSSVTPPVQQTPAAIAATSSDGLIGLVAGTYGGLVAGGIVGAAASVAQVGSHDRPSILEGASKGASIGLLAGALTGATLVPF